MRNSPYRYYLLIAAMLATYITSSLVFRPAPSVAAKYGLSQTAVTVITLSVAIAFGAIWVVGVYGFVKLLQYSSAIRKTPDGAAFHTIAAGLGVIAFRFPVLTIFNSLTSQLVINHPEMMAGRVIIANYIGVVTAVIGFWLISLGADSLMNLTRKKPARTIDMIFRFLALVLVTVYTYLAIGRGGYQTPLTPDGTATFYLSNWLIVATIIVPYAYAWYAAFRATFDLRFYAQNVQGVVYRKALRWLANGITWVVVNTIVLQFLGARAGQINKLNLAPLLAVIYILLLSIAIGFGIIARGTKKMQRIEEV